MAGTEYIYVDREGKMPQLRKTPWKSKSHPYYVKYYNDKPVAYFGPPKIIAGDVSKTKVYDYSKQEFVPLADILRIPFTRGDIYVLAGSKGHTAQSLAELFDIDPDHLGNKDIIDIIAFLVEKGKDIDEIEETIRMAPVNATT